MFSQHSGSFLFIDWEKGAEMRLKPVTAIYSQAASNTRAIAALSINFLRTNPRFNITNAHCIGFSLGS